MMRQERFKVLGKTAIAAVCSMALAFTAIPGGMPMNRAVKAYAAEQSAEKRLAAEGTWKVGENATATLKDNVLTVSGTGSITETSALYKKTVIWDSESNVKLVIEDGITEIAYKAFYNCTGLTQIEIPDSVTTIGGYAFYKCSGLTEVKIPNGVTSIGNMVFYGCNGLTAINVSEGNAIYDSRNHCNAIIKKKQNYLILGCKNTVIPDSVTRISEGAFGGCSGLTEIRIPNSVTHIVYSAFQDCSGLTEISIPDSVIEVWGDTFSGCSSLTTITVSEDNAVYDSRNHCNAIIEKETNKLVTGCQSTVIPGSVTKIGEFAFSGCSQLTEIHIPDSVTGIEGWAFYGCRGLLEIYIPSSITEIGYGAFFGCKSLIKAVNHSAVQFELPAGSEPWHIEGTETVIKKLEGGLTAVRKGKTGVVIYDDGSIFYYENGRPSTTYTGMAEADNGKKYWFDSGVAARDKQVYDPATDAWYWFDADGSMAVDKDVYVPESNDNRENGKWVRYDENGCMVKGEDYRYGGWYRFDEITGEMIKGWYTAEDGKKYYYNNVTGQREHGAVNIDGVECAFDDETGAAINCGWYIIDGSEYWYQDGIRQGYDANDATYRGKEIYDPASDAWCWLDNVNGGRKAVSKDVYQESWAGEYADNEDGTGKWVRYDADGHMVKGWDTQNGNKYYFDMQTGAMVKGLVLVDGQEYYFDMKTGICQ